MAATYQELPTCWDVHEIIWTSKFQQYNFTQNMLSNLKTWLCKRLSHGITQAKEKKKQTKKGNYRQSRYEAVQSVTTDLTCRCFGGVSPAVRWSCHSAPVWRWCPSTLRPQRGVALLPSAQNKHISNKFLNLIHFFTKLMTTLGHSLFVCHWKNYACYHSPPL